MKDTLTHSSLKYLNVKFLCRYFICMHNVQEGHKIYRKAIIWCCCCFISFLFLCVRENVLFGRKKFNRKKVTRNITALAYPHTRTHSLAFGCFTHNREEKAKIEVYFVVCLLFRLFIWWFYSFIYVCLPHEMSENFLRLVKVWLKIDSLCCNSMNCV